VFAATAADVREVVVGGRRVVADGRHLTLDVPAALRDSLAAVLPEGAPPAAAAGGVLRP